MTITSILEKLGSGFLDTLQIFGFTVLFSIPLGWIVYFGRVSANKVVSAITKFYISVMRGTPLMLQLIIWYFGPFYLWGANLKGYKFTAIIIGFAVNYAAYFAEIYRSGMEAMDKGQYEAAEILGYSKFCTFFHIILPQVVKIVIPSVGNEIITLVKDTSLVYSIAYVEMFAVAKQIAAARTSILPLFAAGLFYWVFNALVAGGLGLIEKKLNYYR